MKQNVHFIIIIYKPDKNALYKLRQVLKGNSFIVVDNEKNNLGFAGGFNAGTQKIFDYDFEWIITLNQDLHLTKQAVKDFKKKLAKSPPRIAGPFAGRFDNTRWTTVLPSKKVDYVSGSCMAVHRDVLEKIGYFYEPYFMYYEDADLCARAKKAGFPVEHVSIKGISHEDGTSLGKGSFLHHYYLARNHLLFVERNAPISVKIHEIVRLPKTVWEHWKRREAGALIGIRDYFFRRFGQYKPL